MRGFLRSGTALAEGGAFELSDQEKLDLRTALNGDIYLNQRTRRPILLRLDEMLSDGTAHYDHSLLTIEHVLPQNPNAGSEWLVNFPDQEVRDRWIHRLANLVLLSKYKNPAASNYDFEYKKNKYFSQDGDSSFVLTSQVRQEPVWTANVLETRQKKLVDRMFAVWELK